MQPKILPLEPDDEATVEAVHGLRVAVEAADIPDFPPPCRVGFRGELRHQVSSWRNERFVARLSDEVVGYLVLELPLKENLDNAEVTLAVHPEHRRRGVGRALHRHLLERLRELSRARYATNTVGTLPGGPARNEAGAAFAAAVGAAAALDEVRRRLDLTTLDRSALAALQDEARARSTGYRLVSWRDRTPDALAADAGYLDGRLVSDAPMGDLQWEAPQMDTARLREREEMLAACHRPVFSTGAVHEESGKLVALTALGQQESSPWHAFQWITLVDPPHRGRRLGALVKVANLAYAEAQEPRLRVVDTWNAAVNQHMIAINEAMGFRRVDRWVNWQQEV